MKISVEQLKQLNKEEYILIDIRDSEEAFKNPIENSAEMDAARLHRRARYLSSPHVFQRGVGEPWGHGGGSWLAL